MNETNETEDINSRTEEVMTPKPIDRNSETVLFDESIQNIELMFKYSGLNLKNKIKTPKDIFKHRWLFVFNFVWVFTATIGSIYYVIIGIANDKDFIEVTSIAPCLTFTIIAIIKSLFHCKYESDVQELINLIRALEVKQSERDKSIDKEEIANTEIGFLNKVIKVLYILSVSMMVVFDVTPFLLIGLKYYQTQEFEMLLPFLDIFTFMPYKFEYWLFGYIHQIWAEAIVLLDMGAADYLFFTCCTHIRVQFQLLQYDFERIIPSRRFSKNDVQDSKEFHEYFTELVNWHQDLIHCVDILEIIYSKSTLSNFLSSSLVLCLTGFNVTIVTDVVVIITYLTFLSMALMQVFCLCFFADLLSSASMEISDAVYRSRWYESDTAVGSQMLLVQTRAQKPCKLTAAGFADVNLNAFMRVLSTAWSYFALLQTLYSR